MLLHSFRRYVVDLYEMLAFGINPHSKESADGEDLCRPML